MCGIAGVLGPSFDNPLSLATIRHRGPDAQGEWTSEVDRIWLGHTRLSILDLSESGSQPMAYMDGRYRIVFNGEIYNFVELQEELGQMGYRFRGSSDTETIPAAFNRWGIGCLNRFNGMYAFAIWDSATKKLWLARDRFGKKPLYYYAEADDLVFASEVRAIHHWLGPRAEINPEVIRSICAGRFEWHGTDNTYLAGVKTLPAGFYLCRSPDKLRVERWYQLAPYSVRVPESLSDQAGVLRELMVDACTLRLRSDVPVATCLSGGLDSSSITALIHRRVDCRGKRATTDFHHAFCAAFPGTMIDEQASAAAFAKSVGVQLEICEIKPPTPERLVQAISSCDGPMHALAFYPIWELYRMVRERGIKVTLDGQGPDEMMGGYFESIRGGLRAAVSPLNLKWFVDIFKTYRNQGESPYRSSRALAVFELAQLLKSPLSRLKRGLVEAIRDNVAGTAEPSSDFVHAIPASLDPFRENLYSSFCQTQLPTILQQYDRCSMSHGVECRMPFMDHRIVEFVFSLPNESLVGGGFTKRVLREAVAGIVPEQTRINKVKIGFNAPIVEWFLDPLREMMLDTMRSGYFLQSQLFDGRGLADDFETWLKSPRWDSAWAFWPPVHYALWRQTLSES
jgi:asparagine synthase (glutamine-hydrolysing)